MYVEAITPNTSSFVPFFCQEERTTYLYIIGGRLIRCPFKQTTIIIQVKSRSLKYLWRVESYRRDYISDNCRRILFLPVRVIVSPLVMNHLSTPASEQLRHFLTLRLSITRFKTGISISRDKTQSQSQGCFCECLIKTLERKDRKKKMSHGQLHDAYGLRC